MFEHPELNIIKFDSVSEVGQFCEKNNFVHIGKSNNEWHGDEGKLDSFNMCISGDTKSVAVAEAMMAEFQKEIYTECYSDQPSVAGYYPCVPDAISGDPECMRELAISESDISPINIIVDVTCSCGFDAVQMRKRGTAILAVVMALSAVRPVTLTAVAPMYGRERSATEDLFCLLSTRIETAPLDLATAGFALTNISFFRRLLLGIGNEKFETRGNWATFQKVSSLGRKVETPEYRKTILKYLDADENSLYIDPSSYSENGEMLANNPKQWVRNMIDKHGQQHSD